MASAYFNSLFSIIICLSGMFDSYIMFYQGCLMFIDLVCVNLFVEEIEDTCLFDIYYIPRRRLSLMQILYRFFSRSLFVHKFV